MQILQVSSEKCIFQVLLHLVVLTWEPLFQAHVIMCFSHSYYVIVFPYIALIELTKICFS